MKIGSLVTVGLRYAGLLLQFLIIVVLARALDEVDYGRYMLSLSIVLPTYFLFGFGVPERELRNFSSQLTHGSENRAEMLGNTILASVVSLALCALIAILLICAFNISQNIEFDIAVAIFALSYFSANGIVYATSQVILALGRDITASFLFYPAVNISVLVGLVAGIASGAIEFDKAATIASLTSAFVAAIAVFWGLNIANSNPKFDIRIFIPSLKEGLRFAAARSLYSVGASVPSFVAAAAVGLAATGEMATATRLAAAVAAALAAVRFSLRPRMAASASSGDITSLVRMNRRAALYTFTFSLLCFLLFALVGNNLVVMFFGEKFDELNSLIILLLVGVLFEAYIGPADESLKMAGFERSVILVFAFTVGVAVAACLYGARWGVYGLAIGYVVASALSSASLAAVFRKRFGVWPYPSW